MGNWPGGHPAPPKTHRQVCCALGAAPPRIEERGVWCTKCAWCEHHYSVGVEHIVLVFDHLEQPQEAADAARLRSTFGSSRLTIWSGAQLMADGWPALPADPNLA